MRTEAREFQKYDEIGAYHWEATYDGGWRRRSPMAHARYDALLLRLQDRLDLRTARGLDVGCGDGVMMYKVSRLGGWVAGLDLEYTGVRIARERLERRGAAKRLVCGSGYDLPFADESLHYVVAAEVIEHLEQPAAWLAEVHRVLAPGGVLALSTPHRYESGELHDVYHCREYDGASLREELARVFADVRVEGQYPQWLHRMYQLGTGVRALDLAARFGIKALASAGFNPFVRWTTDRPGFAWDGLVAVAHKS